MTNQIFLNQAKKIIEVKHLYISYKKFTEMLKKKVNRLPAYISLPKMKNIWRGVKKRKEAETTLQLE